MYIGSLPAGSNRATYHQDFQIYDDEADEGIDLAGAAIRLEIRKPGCAAPALGASIDNGRIVVTDAAQGVFALVIDADAMRGLAPMTYECGITVAQNGATTQYLIGTLPILDGVVN